MDMIERPVIGSTTLLTIVISMKRTQITPLLLSQHGGGNVNCWGCISSSGVGNLVFIDGNMIGEVYRDTGWLKSFESKNERMCIF